MKYKKSKTEDVANKPLTEPSISIGKGILVDLSLILLPFFVLLLGFFIVRFSYQNNRLSSDIATTITSNTLLSMVMGVRTIDLANESLPPSDDSIDYGANLTIRGYIDEVRENKLSLVKQGTTMDVYLADEDINVYCIERKYCDCDDCTVQDVEAGMLVEVYNSYEGIEGADLINLIPTRSYLMLK